MSSQVIAAEIQSLQSIRDTAKDFVLAQYAANDETQATPEVIPGKLDRRLRLAQCDEALQASYSTNTRNSSRQIININCDGSQPWTIYVPVQVKVFENIVVLAHAVSRNSILSSSDLRLERRDINKMTSGYFSDLSEVVGKSLSRSVSGGLALNPAFVKSPRLVKRGDKVILMAEAQGITVKMSGKALANGRAGDRIQVKNLSSQRVIEGVVNEKGMITTQM